jgi:hypothetical protein
MELNLASQISFAEACYLSNVQSATDTGVYFRSLSGQVRTPVRFLDT